MLVIKEHPGVLYDGTTMCNTTRDSLCKHLATHTIAAPKTGGCVCVGERGGERRCMC